MSRASTIWADSGIQAAVQGKMIGPSLAGGLGGEVITDRRIGLTGPPWVPAGPGGVKRNTADNFFTNLAEFAFVGPMTRDRPIGIAYRSVPPVVPPVPVLPRRAIVLTRETLEASLPPVPVASTGTSSEEEAARKLSEMLAKFSGSSVTGGSTTTSSTPTGSGEALAGAGPESTQIVVPLIDGPGPFMGGNYMLTISIQRLH
jgi:hypothetical protein